MTAQQLREKLLEFFVDEDYNCMSAKKEVIESLIAIVIDQRETLEDTRERLKRVPYTTYAIDEALASTDAKLKEMGVL